MDVFTFPIEFQDSFWAYFTIIDTWHHPFNLLLVSATSYLIAVNYLHVTLKWHGLTREWWLYVTTGISLTKSSQRVRGALEQIWWAHLDVQEHRKQPADAQRGMGGGTWSHRTVSICILTICPACLIRALTYFAFSTRCPLSKNTD